MIVKIFVYLIWISVGLYFGVGGYVALDIEERKTNARYLPESKVILDGIEFRNKELASVYDDENKAGVFFGFIMNCLPKSMIYLLTAMAFGIIGVITRITKEIAIDKSSLKDLRIFSFPILGMMTGILILAVAKIIPNLLVNSQNNLEPLTLAFLSLIAGFCSRQFYQWLISSTNKLFKSS